MNVQIIQDSNGKNTGVFIPYDDWDKLKKQHKYLARLEDIEPTTESILNNIKTGLDEVKLFKTGKLQTISTTDFLNEL